MKKTCGLILGLLVAAMLCHGQGVVFFNTGTTLAVVDTNSTVIVAGLAAATNPNQPGGPARVHYDLLENRGPTVIVFDFAPSITTTTLVINGVTNTVAVGHVLNVLDTYELPAEKEYNGPISAISTNTAAQGVVALTVSHNLP